MLTKIMKALGIKSNEQLKPPKEAPFEDEKQLKEMQQRGLDRRRSEDSGDPKQYTWEELREKGMTRPKGPADSDAGETVKRPRPGGSHSDE